MKFSYDLTGSKIIVKKYPLYGAAADIIEGAALIRGATAGTDSGFGVVATGALLDIIGVLAALHDYSVVGDSANTGLTYVYGSVVINPHGVFRADYDSTDTMAVASTATTTVTVTSLEDNIDGGWLLGNDGQVQYLTASASGSATSKSSSGWTSANTLLKILPLFHQLIKINTAADKLGTDAAAGSGRAAIVDNWIRASGVPLQRLDPTKHSGNTYTSPVISSDIVFLTHAFNIIV